MQKRKLTLAVVGLTSTLLLGSTFAAHAQDADPVAVVNGQPIPQSLLTAYAEQRQAQVGDTSTPEARKNLIDELIIQELLVQQAKEEKLDQDPAVIGQIDMLERNLLATAAARKIIEAQTPSDEDVAKEYEQIASHLGKQEYQARHILVSTEDEAKKVIEELNAGKDFAELAKEHSKDQGSAQQGGDLGWFTPEVMVPPFSEAVTKLEKGQTTQTPVQTQFGFHVIRLDDTRKSEPPKLEEIRPQLVQQLQAQKFNKYLEDLRAKANIETK